MYQGFYFVSNFPIEVDDDLVRQIYEKFGVVSDVYMDKKLAKLGK